MREKLQLIKGKIDKNCVLCSDGYKPYIGLALSHDLIHKRLNMAAGIRSVDKIFHIQNVNAYQRWLKEWMEIFHGVATKYLEHYLGWFRFLDTHNSPYENSLFRIQQRLTEHSQ